MVVVLRSRKGWATGDYTDGNDFSLLLTDTRDSVYILSMVSTAKKASLERCTIFYNRFETATRELSIAFLLLF
jgi:hypothetical protein